MNIQIFVNMVSALIIFIGGLLIVFMYPAHLSSQYRVLIVLFVTVYFLLRVGQTVLAIKRARRESQREVWGMDASEDDRSEGPKSP